MKKINFKKRLQLLNGGRVFYLDFLRNLTPQIILLSFTLLVAIKLDFTSIDLNNFGPTILFYVLLCSFILAFYANSTLLYERCFGEWKRWFTDLENSLNTRGVEGPRRLLLIAQAIWNEQFVEFLEILTVLVFFQIVFAIVIVLSIHSASNIWNVNHHKS